MRIPDGFRLASFPISSYYTVRILGSGESRWTFTHWSRELPFLYVDIDEKLYDKMCLDNSLADHTFFQFCDDSVCDLLIKIETHISSPFT